MMTIAAWGAFEYSEKSQQVVRKNDGSNNWSVERTGPGVYVVTFNEPMADGLAPVVTLTSEFVPNNFVSVYKPKPEGFVVNVHAHVPERVNANGSYLADGPVHFMAISGMANFG